MREIARSTLYNIIMYYHHVEYNEKRTNNSFTPIIIGKAVKPFAANHALFTLSPEI